MKKEKKTTIALTGGATGGHIFPLLSAYNFLKEDENLDFVWVGEEEGLEFDIAMENNIKFLDIPAGKLRRYFDWRNFFEPLKNLTGIFFGIYFILRYRIKVIFSKGGYVALPLCIAGFLLRRKIYIHESDTVSGLANRVIGKMATKVFYTFPNEKTEDVNNQKHIFTGQILNPGILTGIRNMKVEENMFLNVIVIAGSQGSTRIFENVLKVISKLDFVDFTVILGEKNTHFKKSFEKYDNVRTFDFISQKDLGKILKQTDIAITRAGATTLWELAMFGIHSLIVPLTESAGNHQMANAEFFHNKFGSDILDENNNLEKNILEKLTKYKNLRKAGLNLNDFFRPLEIIESEILGKNIDYKKEKIEQFEKDMAEINRADALEKLKKLENERLARNKETSKKIEQENTEKEKQENEFKIEEISQAKTNFQTFSIR
ncbi:glycosyltransferase [Candidatus Gracilibacteria bacterium]|nr:glycosyltransferase [Candidatus Gracilibacteria bacterium]